MLVKLLRNILLKVRVNVILGDPWPWVLLKALKMGMKIECVGSEVGQNEVKYDVCLEKLQIV